MNYKEKYKQALERARDLMTKQNPPAFSKDLISLVFPELKESEDERIRRGIIRNLQFLMDRSEGFVKDDLQERIAWLEKQDTNKEYVFRPLAGTMIENAVEQALKQGNVVLAFNGFYTSVKSKTSDEILTEYDRWLEKQGEQKTVVYVPKFRVGDKLVSTKNLRLTYEVLEVGHINERGNPEYKVEIFTDGKSENPHNIHYMECCKVDEWAKLIEPKKLDADEV